MALSRRFLIAKHWLTENRNDINASELIQNVFRPVSKTIASRYIDRINEKEDSYQVILHNLPRPLYYPREMTLDSLYQVIVELFEEREWHHYEIKETKVAAADIVADCGAAEGLFGLLAADRCKKVYLIEPHPRFIQDLKKTFAPVSNAEIIPYGLSTDEGIAYINDKDISSSMNDSGDGTKIQTTTLDNLFFAKQINLNYLKADLEGSEIAMLEGGRKTIGANKPKIAITTYHRKNDHKEIKRLLELSNPAYKFKFKGIEEKWGQPVMLHAW